MMKALGKAFRFPLLSRVENRPASGWSRRGAGTEQLAEQPQALQQGSMCWLPATSKPIDSWPCRASSPLHGAPSSNLSQSREDNNAQAATGSSSRHPRAGFGAAALKLSLNSGLASASSTNKFGAALPLGHSS